MNKPQFFAHPLAAIATAAALAMMGAASNARAESDDRDPNVKHVLLISVDGMHQVDLERYVA